MATPFDSDQATAGAEAAERDLKALADKVASVNREVERIVSDAYDAGDDPVASARLVVQADDATRRLILANAEYDKQVQVTALLKAVAQLRRNADAAQMRGDTVAMQKYLKGAADTANVLRGFKVTVSVPSKDPEVEKLSGALASLDATGGLGFFNKIGKAVKKATAAAANVKKVVGKVEQAAKYVQKNGAKIGAVAGSIAVAIPVVGPIVGPAVAAGGALLQSTAPRPKPPSDPGAGTPTVVLDPATGTVLPTDMQGNPLVPPGKQIVFDAQGQPIVIPIPGAGGGVSTNTILLGVGGVALVGLFVALLTRREPARAA